MTLQAVRRTVTEKDQVLMLVQDDQFVGCLHSGLESDCCMRVCQYQHHRLGGTPHCLGLVNFVVWQFSDVPFARMQV